jgi:uncharacterized protein (TIGR03435 family)
MAKAGGNATLDQMRPMLQALLADRFHLMVRREAKELPFYELTAARGGLRIEAAKEGSCVTFAPNNPPPRPDPSRSFRPLNLCGGVNRSVASAAPERRDLIEAVGISMPRLIEMVSDEVGRTIVDKTGFIGPFDFRLEFAPESASGGNLSSPSIATALQEQLGLQLKSARGPVEVLVIDHVERLRRISRVGT